MAIPKRKNPRLPSYDYGQNGVYFVTVCTQGRAHILGQVSVGAGVLDGPQVCLSEFGKIVEEQIAEINQTYSDIEIDKYVIMPNHVHLLIRLTGQGPSRTPAPTNARLPQLVSVLKRFTNRKCGISLWQRSYHDHVIRDESDYLTHWQYIDSNPAGWAEDEYYTDESEVSS